MKTTKTLSIAGDYKKLEEKLLELTKDNFSWSIEYEDEETNDMVTLMLCDFVYHEDPDNEGGLLQVKANFDSYLDEQYEKDAMVYIDFFAFDSLKEEGVIDIETEDSQIFLAFYTLFTEMKLL
jgi:hypothetical protein